MRRTKWRRVGKWVGTIASSALALAWLVNGWRVLGWYVDRPVTADVSVVAGNVVLSYGPQRRVVGLGGLYCIRVSDYATPPEWRAALPRVRSLPAGPYRGGFEATVPLWTLILLALLPACWLWLLDRRRPPGHCPKCGYDLTGNTSGLCPECGRAARS